MPRGVYERKKKGAGAAVSRSGSEPAAKTGKDGFAEVMRGLRAELLKAEDRVVALGTAVEALERVEAR